LQVISSLAKTKGTKSSTSHFPDFMVLHFKKKYIFSIWFNQSCLKDFFQAESLHLLFSFFSLLIGFE
jgi:hypothetical protein